MGDEKRIYFDIDNWENIRQSCCSKLLLYIALWSNSKFNKELKKLFTETFKFLKPECDQNLFQYWWFSERNSIIMFNQPPSLLFFLKSKIFRRDWEPSGRGNGKNDGKRWIVNGESILKVLSVYGNDYLPHTQIS